MARCKSQSINELKSLPSPARSASRSGHPAQVSVPTTTHSVGLAGGLFIIILLMPASVLAVDPWTTRDTVLQATVLGLFWVDYRQTLDIAVGSHQDLVETNPMTGNTRQDISRYFLTSAIIHTGISLVLSKDLRLAWQAVAIGVELSCISNNYQLGVSVRF